MSRGNPLHTMGSGQVWSDPDKEIIHFGSPMGKKSHHKDVKEPEYVNLREDKESPDMVEHPPHYTSDPSGVECIEIVRHRNFNIGSAFKYLWRNGLKQDADRPAVEKQIEDLQKAVFYIQDEIQRLRASS